MRRRLRAAALLAGLWLAALTGIQAQVSPGVVEKVVVTGRWIPGRPEDAALPVTRTTRDEMRLEGSPGVIDVLRNLSFSQGADGESDQYGSRTGADRATVNLRGLGPSRSLVLLNSRRVALSPGSIPDQAQLVVDVNLLPFANDSLTFDATILNLTDREPPRVYRQLNYDPLTHNPLGRLVEVGLRWRM